MENESITPHGDYACALCGYRLETLKIYTNLVMKHTSLGHEVRFTAEDVWVPEEAANA